MTSFHFSVMAWCIWFDQLMANTIFFEYFLKQSEFSFFRCKPIRKFLPVISLYTFDRIRKYLYQMFGKYSRRISAVFFKSLNITPSGVFIDCCILIKFLSFGIANQSGCRNEFYINLNAFSRTRHTFIRFWYILWIRGLYSHNILFTQESVQSCNRTGIATLR